MITDTAAETPAEADTSLQPAEVEATLTFEEAEKRAGQAREHFAELKRKYGDKVALADFNARVRRWTNEHTNPRLSRVMHVVGSAMDGETHEYAISINGKKGDRGGLAEDKLLDRYHKTYASKKRTISYRQFYRYLAMAESEGLITRTSAQDKKRGDKRKPGDRVQRQGERGLHPGAFLPTMTHVNFWMVLKDDQVLPHDFGAPLPEQIELPHESHQPQNGTPHGTPHDTHSYVPLEPNGPHVSTKQGNLLGGREDQEATEPITLAGKQEALRRTVRAQHHQQHQNKTCEFCGKPATQVTRVPPFSYSCLEHEGKIRAITRPISFMDELGDNRNRGEYENDFYVDRRGTFWRCSTHKRGHGERRISLDKNEAIFLFSGLKRFGPAPNNAQHAYMAMLAGFKQNGFPADFPKPPRGAAMMAVNSGRKPA